MPGPWSRCWPTGAAAPVRLPCAAVPSAVRQSSAATPDRPTSRWRSHTQGAVQSTPAVRDDASAVQLVYTDVYDNGCPTFTVARGFVEVRNLAYQKQVTLVYSLDGGPFQEFDTWFRTTIVVQREIWWFQLGLQRSLRVALRYTVAGQQ